MCQITRKYNPEYTNINNEMFRIVLNYSSEKPNTMIGVCKTALVKTPGAFPVRMYRFTIRNIVLAKNLLSKYLY